MRPIAIRSKFRRHRQTHFEPLESRRLLAALGQGNVLVSYDATDSVREYSFDGQLQQEWSTSQIASGKPRDITVDAQGDVQVYFGTFDPTLERIDPTTGSVDVYSIPGWSTAGNISYGGIADFENYLFLTDMNTSGASEQGIIRVNTNDNSYERFATDRGFVDVTLGRDGLIYALEEYSPHKRVRGFDPQSMAQVVGLTLPHQDHRGVAVDADGNLYTPMWSGGEIRKYDSSGLLLATLDTGINNLQDIDIHSDGRIIVGSWGGDVILTDTELSTFTSFDTGSTSSIFVAFTEDDPIPAPPNQPPVADDLDVDVLEGESVSFVLSGVDDSTPPASLTYTVASLPSGGVLTANGSPVFAGQELVGGPLLEFEFGADSNDLVTEFTFTIRDDGDPALISDPGTVQLTTVSAVADGSVVQDEHGVVRIGGTSANDKFVLQAQGDFLQVKLGGLTISNDIALASVTEIRGWGRAGDDQFNVKGLTIETVLFGQDGNDRLFGGEARDLLFGGLGNDKLRGRGGSDLLSGGAGSDDIRANKGEDLLVGGQLDSSLTIAGLEALLQDWADHQDADAISLVLATRVIDADYDYIRGGGQLDYLVASLEDDYRGAPDSVLLI